jgi:hypothetical protein
MASESRTRQAVPQPQSGRRQRVHADTGKPSAADRSSARPRCVRGSYRARVFSISVWSDARLSGLRMAPTASNCAGAPAGIHSSRSCTGLSNHSSRWRVHRPRRLSSCAWRPRARPAPSPPAFLRELRTSEQAPDSRGPVGSSLELRCRGVRRVPSARAGQLESRAHCRRRT